MSRMLSIAAMAGVVLTPWAASAQEPPRTKELKDAEKFIVSAQFVTDSAQRRARFEQALEPLQQAITKNPENARVWFATGQVYSGLRNYARADSAFDKAEQLYPPIADEVNTERLQAWSAAFEAGLALMDAQQYPAAIAALEEAEIMYAQRPESKLNLGILYANQRDLARAEEAFKGALALTKASSPTDSADAAMLRRFTSLATVNIAQLVSQRGADAYDAQRFDDAIRLFREAHEINPLARDYTYNLAQSLYAKARAAEGARAQLLDEGAAARAKKDLATANAKSAQAKQLATEIVALYTEMAPMVDKSRAFDPNNEDLFLLAMRSIKMRADLTSAAAAKTALNKQAAELLAQHQALTAEITHLSASPSGGDAVVRGTLRNIKLTAGAPVKISMTLLGMDGGAVSEHEIIVTAPAVNEEVQFESKAKLDGDIAGWKYVLR
ncbi:MAG: tetratricopeptide repeat protein [Gemmatimonadota bacterium]